MKHSKWTNIYAREKEKKKQKKLCDKFSKIAPFRQRPKHYLLHLSLQIRMISINIVSLDSH